MSLHLSNYFRINFTSDYTITKRMRSFLGDIRNVSDIISAVDGVDYVIHVAGLISVGNFPDEIGLEEINRQGEFFV